jgi:PAS domain S-box-containing protein
VSVDSLHLQITSALNRLSQLQRRASQLPNEPPNVLLQALSELEQALEELRIAQQHLIEQRDEIEALHSALEQERQKYYRFFDDAPDAYLVTSPQAHIIEANRAAAELLNISQRFLVGKNLSVFICSDRNRMLTQAQQLAESGGAADWVFSLRPRERAPFRVAVRAIVADDTPERSLRWMLRRMAEEDGRPTPAQDPVVN